MIQDKEVNIFGTVFKPKQQCVPFDEEMKATACQFGREYWDDSSYPGYAGYYYDDRWKGVAKRVLDFFPLKEASSILDIGCGKGFMLYELSLLNPSLKLQGIDPSLYAIENAKEEVRDRILLGKAEELPFADKSVDLVYSIDTLYMLSFDNCTKAIQEIERVAKNAMIQVLSYRSQEEKEKLVQWDCTAQVVLSVEEWKALFQELGYTGYYYWKVFL